MEKKTGSAELIAVVSDRDQKILARFSGTAEARMHALDMVSKLRSEGKEEEAANIYVLEAFEMTEEEKEEVEKNPMSAGMLALAARPEHRRLYYYMASTLSPLNLDHSVIPYGDYCYEWVQDPNAPGDGLSPPAAQTDMDHPDYWDLEKRGLTTRACPYYTSKEIAGVKVPWCLFIGSGGLPWDTTDEQEEALMWHFGGINEMRENLPYGWLWDSMKCCHLNHYFKE